MEEGIGVVMPDKYGFGPIADTFTGFSLHVEPMLAGGRKSVLVGGRKLYLSPAMYDLVSHAEGDELRRILSRIELVHFPAMPSLTELMAQPWFTPETKGET